MWRVVVVGMLVLSSVASADEFGGWKVKAPTGYTRSESPDHVTYVKITGKTFCQFVLFAARPPGEDDNAAEWQTTVVKTFASVTPKSPVSGKTKSLAYVATPADIQDGAGNAFALTHYFLQADGGVSSLVVTSSTTKTLKACPVKALVNSLALVPAAAATPAAPAAPASAPASDAIVLGTWATSSTGYAQGVSLGSTVRTYIFNANGTYRYYSQGWGGNYRSGWYYLVDETGAWQLSGDQLTISPAKATATEVDETKKTKKTSKLALEKVTYAVTKAYMSGIKEWDLIMTTPHETKRDGAFASNDAYKNSYMLSDTYKPEWRYPP